MTVIHMKSAIKYFNKWGWIFDRKRKETNKKYNEVVTVAINLKSTSLGKKGIIKIEDKDGKDRDYPMTYKEAFRKVSHHFGFSKKKLHIQVLLGNDRLFWVFNKNGKTKSVDMLTGKVYNATLGKGNDVYRGKDDE